MQLLRVATHGCVVLLNEEPANLILGDVILLFGSGGGRGGGLGRLEVGRSVHSSMSVVEGVGVGMLDRVVAVDRSLGHIGHDDGGA